MLITFSGLDGAGKSTLIQETEKHFLNSGKKVKVLNVYDHLGIYAFIRLIRDSAKKQFYRLKEKEMKYEFFTNDPDRIGLKQAKRGLVLNLLYRFMRHSAVKRSFLLIDLVVMYFYRLYFEGIRNRILVFDRYFYDSLADITEEKGWGFVLFFLKMAPKPNLSFFIDVPPETAFERKREYSIEYMTRRRKKYKRLFSLIPNGIILSNVILKEAKHNLINILKGKSVHEIAG